MLADIKRTQERKAYSMMDFLSDFGGFNEGIKFFPSLFFGFYAARMYHNDVYSQMPVKQKRKPNGKNNVQMRFSSDRALGG